MNIAVCLDDKNGMLFCGRRQSKDQYLRQQLLQLAQPGILWMNGFSAKQFDPADAVHVAEDFLETAPQGQWCFVENVDVLPYKEKIEKIDADMAACATDFTRLQELSEEKEKLEEKLEERMERWMELSELAEEIERNKG